MAATFNPNQIMTSDFYEENYSEDMSLSSHEIEHVLGISIEPDIANFIDSMTGKEAYSLLCDILESVR